MSNSDARKRQTEREQVAHSAGRDAGNIDRTVFPATYDPDVPPPIGAEPDTESDALGAEVLSLLMQAWGCGPGEIVTEHVGADVDGGPGEIPIAQLCKSNAHNYAYWGRHCGFAGDAAGLVVVAAQNLAARVTSPGGSS